MSGGSYNYIYNKLSVECEGEMHDAEMDDLIKDLCEVLHDLEWWQSGDYSEEQYRETVSEFKKKWFKSDRTSRLIKSYIIDQLDAVKSQLNSLMGEVEKPKSCSECKFFSNSSFYADNSIFVSQGSCMKCQRNMTTIDPHEEIPIWCPLKGDEDE